MEIFQNPSPRLLSHCTLLGVKDLLVPCCSSSCCYCSSSSCPCPCPSSSCCCSSSLQPPPPASSSCLLLLPPPPATCLLLLPSPTTTTTPTLPTTLPPTAQLALPSDKHLSFTQTRKNQKTTRDGPRASSSSSSSSSSSLSRRGGVRQNQRLYRYSIVFIHHLSSMKGYMCILSNKRRRWRHGMNMDSLYE